MITDGIWIWPGEISYYVKKYNLKLNEEFIQAMRENNRHIKKPINTNFDNVEIT